MCVLFVVFERVCVDKKLELIKNLLAYLKGYLKMISLFFTMHISVFEDGLISNYFASYCKLKKGVQSIDSSIIKNNQDNFARISTSIDYILYRLFVTLLQTQRYEIIPGCEIKRHTMFFLNEGSFNEPR